MRSGCRCARAARRSPRCKHRNRPRCTLPWCRCTGRLRAASRAPCGWAPRRSRRQAGPGDRSGSIACSCLLKLLMEKKNPQPKVTLLRAGNGMTPPPAALHLVGPAGILLQEADPLFSPRSRRDIFEPATSTITFRIAASDYLDPLFLPELVAHLKKVAPLTRLELLPL